MPPDFLAFCQVLTGFAELDPEHAEMVFERYGADADLAPHLQPMLVIYRNLVAQGGDSAAVETGIAAQIMQDPTLGPAAQQLILLWYVGAFFKALPSDPTKPVWQYGPDGSLYGAALVWSAVLAHAPMTAPGPGLVYGYWADPPRGIVSGQPTSRQP